MTPAEIKLLPIQFSKVFPGVYVSTDGRWRIHKTEHTGYMSTLQGRTRWHITEIATGQPAINPWQTHNPHSYTLSLADAIEELHRVIVRGIVDGFTVLHDVRREGERREAEARQRVERIDAATAKIAAFVAAHGAITDRASAWRLAEFLEG